VTGARCYETGAHDGEMFDVLSRSGAVGEAENQARCAAQDVGLVPFDDLPSPEVVAGVFGAMLSAGDRKAAMSLVEEGKGRRD
jgi:hypothetical protein